MELDIINLVFTVCGHVFGRLALCYCDDRKSGLIAHGIVYVRLTLYTIQQALTSAEELSDACFSSPLCSFTEQTFVSIHENYG